MNIDATTYRSKHGFDSRIRFLVMHYTADDFATSIDELTGPRVSAHYVVPDPTDPSYMQAGFSGVRVFNLVDEANRAWHAGVSAWRGFSNLNDSAIGIEIVNRAHESDGQLVFPPFDDQQIQVVKDLALDILARYPSIVPINVVGHSDIAPTRKNDPGPMFPWQLLAEAGVGPWYDDVTKARFLQQYSLAGVDPRSVVQQLGRYGYDVSAAGTAEGMKTLFRAFQMHYRPSNYDGVLDVETTAILAALLDKYC